MTREKQIISNSPEETFTAGNRFAEKLSRNSITGLTGDLGSGKTIFVKGICDYFNVKDNVTSPTFIIVNEYTGKDPVNNSEINIYHFDLYRLKNIKELLDIGFENYTGKGSVCLIEWPEVAAEYLKNNLINILFEHGKSENERIIKFV